MRKISKHKKTRILKSLFQGDSYGAGAEKEDVSKSTVKMVFDEFVGRASDVSIEGAAAEYNIEDEIEVLRELAVEARRGDFSVGDLLAGVRINLWMHKLKTDPVEFQEYLNIYERHKKEFGNFLDAAIEMSNLETQSGKDYKKILDCYKETKMQLQNVRKELKETREDFTEKKKKMEGDIQDLKNTYDSEAKNLKSLRIEAAKAQEKIDRLETTRRKLAEYHLAIGDFETVTAFVDEIQRLGGDAKKAVRILKETSSLEDKLEKLRHELFLQTLLQEKKTKEFTQQIRQLELIVDSLDKAVDEKKEEFRGKNNVIIKLKTKIEELKERRQALEQQVDGLIKQQAEKLRVLPDIDAISEGISKGREEIKRLDQLRKEKEIQIAAAVAIQDLLARRPSERKAIIQFLQSAQISKTYGYFDEPARKAIIQVMAQQGFVQKEELERVQKEAEGKIKKAQEEAKTWHNIAERRLEDLQKCQDQLKEKRKNEDELLDKQIDQKIADLATEFAKRVQTG